MSPKPSSMLDFPAFLTKCLPALMQVMPHVALPSSERKNGFPSDLHEAAHRLYFAYKSMVESCEAHGWSDDFTKMDYDLRAHTGDVMRDDLLMKYAPEKYAAQEDAKTRQMAEALRVKADADVESRKDAWRKAGAVVS